MTRVMLGCAGVVAAAYGGWLLLEQGRDNLVHAATWLVVGVLLHDAVLAPVVIVLGALAVRMLPASARGGAALLLIVLGTTTLVAFPVLGRFGERPDNPTLLDRDYGTGWLVVAGLTLVAALLLTWASSRSRRVEKE